MRKADSQDCTDRVTFATERERRDTSGVKPLAVFRFLSEDWSPWIALLRMRERWPALRFETRAGYLELIAGGAVNRPII